MADLDARMRVLEITLAVMTGAGTVAAVFLGKEAIYDLPKAIQDNVKTQLETLVTSETKTKLEALNRDATASRQLVTTLTKDGTLNVAGQCYVPMQLVRCYQEQPHEIITKIVPLGATDCSEIGNFKLQSPSEILVGHKCP